MIRIQTQKKEEPSEPMTTTIWGWLNYFNPYARPPPPPATISSVASTDTSSRGRRHTLTEMSIFKLISEILSYCNRQTVVIRQISAILPLLIHGPIRIFLQKYLLNILALFIPACFLAFTPLCAFVNCLIFLDFLWRVLI